jgi:hypothetical protein
LLLFPVVVNGASTRASYRIALDYRHLPERELVANPFLEPPEVARPYYVHAAMRERVVVRTMGGKAPVVTRRVVHTLEIVLVVLRGVKVDVRVAGADGPDAIEGFPEFLEQAVQQEVLRVQDVKLVPPMGYAIDRDAMFPAYNTAHLLDFGGAPGRTSEIRRRTSLANVVVRYVPNGVQFQWLWTKQVLEIRAKDPQSSESGFSFSVDLDHPGVGSIDFAARNRYERLLNIKVCGAVQIRASFLSSTPFDPIRLSAGGAAIAARTTRESLRFYRIERVKRLGDLPASGEPFRCKAHDSTVEIGELDPDVLSKVAIDMVIGSIPVVGDLVEIGEFFYAYATGKDKYGDEVDNAQLALMGLGAILPVVGAGVLRAARRGSTPEMAARLGSEAE